MFCSLQYLPAANVVLDYIQYATTVLSLCGGGGSGGGGLLEATGLSIGEGKPLGWRTTGVLSLGLVQIY